ncbi:hypothetical protein LVJ94_08575 [Pendulispora rubella]|uniref:Uncharacterized protein n=1 Tax=Pendulispora rubella TaxID=2741070 RepID=A0ABZ2LDP9_9BACT
MLRKMVAALRPGGWVLVEDSDYGTFSQLRGGDEALFNKVREAFLSLLASGGHDRLRGRKLGCLLREQGLEDVRFECQAVEWDGFLALIRSPGFVGLTSCGCAAWGREPA